MYEVNLCGAHPDEDDFDDCWTGLEYPTLEEARAVFDAADPLEAMAATIEGGTGNFAAYHRSSTTHVWLSGPDVHEVRELKKPRRRRDDAEDWRREQAMQAGMGMGIDAYNDAMGWGAEPYSGEE